MGALAGVWEPRQTSVIPPQLENYPGNGRSGAPDVVAKAAVEGRGQPLERGGGGFGGGALAP